MDFLWVLFARKEIMKHLAPEGPVYQAGNLSGNPLAMEAGFAMLTYLDNNPDVFESLEKTEMLHQGMETALDKKEFTIRLIAMAQCYQFILPKSLWLILKQPHWEITKI